MDILKGFMPYIVSILTAIISGISSYCLSKRNFKNEVETIKINNEHEINKLMEQHKIDIENLKEKHILEMDAKSKEYEHEKEILELKSKNNINEKNQEMMSSAMSGILGNVVNDVISGKIKPEEIKKLAKDFPNNKHN